jgi:hypothetical protein
LLRIQKGDSLEYRMPRAVVERQKAKPDRRSLPRKYAVNV